MSNYNVEEEFQRSLELMGLKVKGVIETPPHTIHLMRMAYYAGVGCFIDFQVRKWQGIPTEELHAATIDLGQQIQSFWQQQAINIRSNSN